MVKELYAEIDKRTDELRERYPWWPCSQGPSCSKCCHSLFPARKQEAEYLLEGYNSLTEWQKSNIRQRARKAINRLAKRIDTSNWTVVIGKLHKEDYCCPFLEGGVCLVYEYRPSICRMFGYTAFAETGGMYSCQKVIDSVRSHLAKGARVQARGFERIAEMMKGLTGPAKPIVAWIDVLNQHTEG